MTLSPALTSILLLMASNIFMTIAWYGHLKFKGLPIYLVILASWGIAFFEYCLMVPANRIGHQTLSAAELKTIQELISISVFVVFSIYVLGESLTWKQGLGFALMALGAVFIIHK